MLDQRRKRWPIITPALAQSIVLSGKWPGVGVRKRHCYAAVPQQTWDNDPMLFQCWAIVEGCSLTLKQHWVNVMCLLMSWCKIYSRPSVGLVLDQHCRRLTGDGLRQWPNIEPELGV